MRSAVALVVIAAVYLIHMTESNNAAEIYDGKQPKHEYFESTEHHKHDRTIEEASPTELSLNETFGNSTHNSTKSSKRCQLWEHEKRARLEIIKAKILEKLGMDKPPNITKPLADIPEHLLKRLIAHNGFQELQHDSPMHYEDKKTTRTEKIIIFASKNPNKFMKPEHTSHGYSFFEFSPQVRDAQIIEARLHVYIRQQEAVQTTATWLHIYELGPPGKHHYNKIACSRKIELSSRKGHWEQFDIQRVVFGWFHDHESNWGLDIDATDHEGNSVVVTSSDWGSEDHQRMPYLELRTRQHNLRHKRSPELNCDEKSEEERCCRYPLVVDFVELTWDWIIAPKTYSAYYCAGECPNVYNLQNAHSYFVERANPRGHAGRCCTGSEMSPISMIYFIDEKSIMFGVVPDMVTIKCECS